VRIVVDSGVWIDLYANRDTVQTRSIDALVKNKHQLLVGDLILAEVLQGTRGGRHLNIVLARLGEFAPIVIADREVAIDAARHYQHLRGLGITIRRTIDTLIAARCIRENLPLLYADRDFHPFIEHRGLRSALDLVSKAP